MTVRTKTSPRKYSQTGRVKRISSSGSEINFTPVSSTMSWNDVVTQDFPRWNYRKIIAEGGNATTDASGSIRTINVRLGSECRLRNVFIPNPSDWNEYIGTGCLIHQPIWNNYGFFDLVMSSSNADNQALSNFYSHVAQERNKFKTLVFFGELRETLRMIRRPAQSLRRGVGDYLSHVTKYGRRIPRRRRLAWLEDTWLEYSFGWVPLISDLDSAIRAFYSSNLVRPIFVMVSGKGRQERIVANHSGIIAFAENPFQIWIDGVEKESVEVIYRGVNHSTGSGASESLHRYGFAPSDFIPTIWELIPYSFLVDYFTNVGSILESWSYRSLFQGWISRTTFRKGSFESLNERVVGTNQGSQISSTASGDPGSLVSSQTSFVREASVSLSVPSLELKLPGSWWQWANIAALTKSLSRAREALA